MWPGSVEFGASLIFENAFVVFESLELLFENRWIVEGQLDVAVDAVVTGRSGLRESN